jgi:hypothetical protein
MLRIVVSRFTAMAYAVEPAAESESITGTHAGK